MPEYERIAFEMLGTVPADLLAELKFADELCGKVSRFVQPGICGTLYSRQVIAGIIINWKIRNNVEL